VGDDPITPKPVVDNPIGANPDTDIKPLPSGTTFIGYDLLPRGEIRRLPAGMTDLGDDAGTSTAWWAHPVVMFAAGAGAVVVYRWWAKRPQRNRRQR
jgi:hypothetical protein